jgi:hypothetical protein
VFLNDDDSVKSVLDYDLIQRLAAA